MAKPSPEQIKRRALASERHKARHFAMQGLYQWQLNATQANEISAQFNVDFNMKGTDSLTVGVGSQILRQLGVQKMRLMGPDKHYNGISGFDLEVVEYVACEA